MFQFTDNDDPDDEGFLDLPLDKSTGKDELNSTKCSEADNLKDILSNCDDDELILSVIDTVDGSMNDESLSKQVLYINQLENVDRTLTTDVTLQNNVRRGSTDRYIAENNVKHKATFVDPCTSTSKAPRVEYERKFPGPAGLIPIKSKFKTPVKYQVLPEGSPKQADAPPGKNDFIFESGCWDQLIKDIEMISPRLLAIIEENTVASVRKMNIICSKPRKLQFFAALIVNIDCSVCDPSIILKDSTGEILGTLHKELWETYSNLLTVGTALLMKQVSVSSITNSRKLYVNVTSNNIVKLYTPQPGAPVLVTEVASISQQDLAPLVKKKERFVFEETHPNISQHIKEVPIRKTSVNSILKTDNINNSRKENTTHKDKFKSKNDPLICSAKLPNSKQTQKEIVFDELDGIDADSLFGEF